MGLREQQLAQVAEAHYRWSEEIRDRLPFRPLENEGSGDYNLEFVDVEAQPEDIAEFVSRLPGGASSNVPTGQAGGVSDGDEG